MIACLPMYDRAALREATDALWAEIAVGLREQGVTPPQILSRLDDYTQMWDDPGLLLGMTCGKPYRDGLYRTTHLVGTFDYGLKGCPRGYYQSYIIAGAAIPADSLQDLAGHRFAFNGTNSESGYACVERAVGTLANFCGEMICSGGHQYSVEMVADGASDFAAIDAVTWRYVQNEAPGLAARVRIVASTPAVAGLPLITRQFDLVPHLSFAVTRALATATDAAARLGISGLVYIPHETYMELSAQV